jgi:integrase
MMTKENFSATRIQSYTCQPGKQQTIHWDLKTPGLGLRVTKAKARAYIFEARLHGATMRITIGDPLTWDLGSAKAEATRLKGMVDRGIDPREVKLEEHARRIAKAEVDAARSVTVGEAWSSYLEERRHSWGERHYQDHLKKAQAGGEKAIRGTRGRGVTVAGPLFPLMSLRLCDVIPSVVEAWAASEAVTRPTSARLAWRLLKGFLSWCSEQPRFATAIVGNPAKTKKTRQSLGAAGVKKDVLQRDQLAAWFAAVRELPNAVTAAYLQTLLLTGARPGEVLNICWDDVDMRWKGLTIRDKVEGVRTIPLTPYVQHLFESLPRRSKFVFSSPVNAADKTPKPMSKPHEMHDRACAKAGIDKLTLHGLRRSFKSLSEWLPCPVGVVAQIMGHKPSATAEKHYTVRELDFLRIHHEMIETWVLERADVRLPAGSSPLSLIAA